MSKPAYLVVDARVHDAERILRYRELAEIAVARFGGRYLARGGATETLEGGWAPQRLVIVAFPSMEAARSFHDSPEYRAARAARAGIADFDILLTEGLEEAPADSV